jgi:hypothetical protein
MKTVLCCIFGLLMQPDTDDPLDSILALDRADDSGQYETKILAHTKKFASKVSREDWRERFSAQGASTSDSVAKAARMLQGVAADELRRMLDLHTDRVTLGHILAALLSVLVCEVPADATAMAASASDDENSKDEEARTAPPPTKSQRKEAAGATASASASSPPELLLPSAADPPHSDDPLREGGRKIKLAQAVIAGACDALTQSATDTDGTSASQKALALLEAQARVLAALLHAARPGTLGSVDCQGVVEEGKRLCRNASMAEPGKSLAVALLSLLEAQQLALMRNWMSLAARIKDLEGLRTSLATLAAPADFLQHFDGLVGALGRLVGQNQPPSGSTRSSKMQRTS